MRAGRYLDLWDAKKKMIMDKLLDPDARPFIQLNPVDFDSAGSRKKYSFNLQYENGHVINNLGGYAVARDLDRILSNDDTIKDLLKTGRFKINLDKDFCLWVQKK